MKRTILLLLALYLCFFPVNVLAMSAETAANKMNDYIYSTFFNNEWKVTNSSSNSSNYDIKINFTNTNNNTFKEVINNVPTKLFNGNAYKVEAFLVDCGSSDSCNPDNLNWNNSIKFYMKKNSSTDIYLYANDVAPDVYNKIIDGNVYYQIETNQKGMGGDVTKSGNANLGNSSQDSSSVDRTTGTLTNPALVGTNTTLTIPSRNSSFWDGVANKCYYFKVDFSSVAPNNDMARYAISPLDESYSVNFILNGNIASGAYRDDIDRSLFGLGKDNIYGLCAYTDEDNFYGKRVTLTFRDTEIINIQNGTDRADAENQLGEDNVGGEDVDWEWLADNLDPSKFNPEGGIACSEIFSNEEGTVGWILNTILTYIKIIGPVLVVLLSAIDFIKAVVGFDEKAMKEAQNKLIIRLVAAVCLFLVPTLVQLLLSFINQTTCII